MFAAYEPLRAKVEAMEEFASVVWTIQTKVEICWNGLCVWLELPQAHVSHK